MSTLAIAAIPHVIPAPTIPNGDVGLAMAAPLASSRDEVIYLVCTHQRVRFGTTTESGPIPVMRASGELGGGIRWNPGDAWASVALPVGARPSAISWAIIDKNSVEAEETPAIDDGDDPDGADGSHREELLPWIYDRHLELASPQAAQRGSVVGGLIEFRLEYIGKRRREALRRPAGAHHRVSQILARTLLYEPHRLVYLLPCDVRVACYESPGTAPVKAEPLEVAAKTTRIARSLLSAVTEEALIAWLGPPYNVQNTGPRRFPKSASGERLAAHGINEVYISLAQLPERVSVRGENGVADHQGPALLFALNP